MVTGIISWIKRLFCKHEMKYAGSETHMELEDGLVTVVEIYKCEKCGKVEIEEL